MSPTFVQYALRFVIPCLFLILGALFLDTWILEKRLSDTSPISVLYKDATFTVESGEIKEEANILERWHVLRTAYVAALHTYDPLFALEGTSLEEAGRSLELLQKSIFDIALLYEEREQDTIRSALYPVEFLESLLDTEALRRALIAQPSSRALAEYHRSLSETLNAYETYLKRLTALYRSADVFPEEVTLRFINGKSSITRLAETLQYMYEEAEARKQELAERKRCTNVPFACPRLQLFTAATKQTALLPHEVPEEILEIREMSWRYRNDSADPEAEPVYLLTESACLSDPAYFDLRPSVGRYRGDEFPLQKTFYLNDLYFYDAQAHQSAFFDSFREDGEAYVFQSITNAYLCPDSAQDYATILTMRYIREYVLSHNSLLELDGHPVIAEFQDTISGAVISDALIEAYLFELSEVLKANTADQNTEATNAMRHLLAVWHQKSASLDLMLNEAVDTNKIVPALAGTKASYSLQSILLDRTYFPLLLLSTNKTVLRKEPTTVDPLPFEPSQFKMASYRELLREKISKEELTKIIVDSQPHYVTIPRAQED